MITKEEEEEEKKKVKEKEDWYKKEGLDFQGLQGDEFENK